MTFSSNQPHEGAASDVPVAVVIVAGVRLYRESLARALEPLACIEVLGTAADWSDACRYVHGAGPRILLVDADLASVGRGARLFAQTNADVRVVALAVADEERAVLSCLEAGVAAYVDAEADLDELVQTIQGAASGELRCSPRIAAALGRRVSDLAAAREPPRGVVHLAAREMEIAHLIEQNMSNQEIASRLWIEVTTVKNHVHHILSKLQIRRRAEVGAWVRGAQRASSG